MQSGGRDVLRLTLPPDAGCTLNDGWLHLWSHDRYVDVWLVRGATSVDEAVARVPQEIRHEFEKFKPTTTTALTVSGTAATRIVGTGVEADDGDAGDADVIVFKLGQHVFVACTHGEGLSAASQEWMLTLVQTAR